MTELKDIIGYLKVVNQVPTKPPRTFEESMVIYLDNNNSPTIKRLYIFARGINKWYYIDMV